MTTLLPLLFACNPAPTDVPQSVGYRSTIDDEADNGERGNLIISEILWSGSVTNDGVWDREDIFIEIRNQGARPVNISDWWLQVEGVQAYGLRIPKSDLEIDVGEHVFLAKKSSGCFPEPDYVLPDLVLPYGDPFRIVLRDVDERLIEPAGSRTAPPFAGGYDGVMSRSMERVELMFGGRGTEPHMWHFYTPEGDFEPNNLSVSEACRGRTHASPGEPNSPDYSGAYAAGSFE